MEVILDKTKYDEIWDKIYDEYDFQPSPYPHDRDEWIHFPIYYVRFRLNSVWSEAQEQIVNSIMKKAVNDEMYALDWRHDCFVFHPNENIPLYYSYYDETRGVNVYFPSYYPNGDYYFFVKMDWSCGLFGHPWRQEICVVGEVLIQEFEKEKERLDIEVIGRYNELREEMYLIRKVSNDELDMAFALIWKVFQQFVAPDYTSEGVDYFYNQFVIGQNFRENFHDNLQTMYGAFENGKLVGILSISKNNHVSCVFVDGNYHRKGIATKLFSKVISELKRQEVERIELNASPYAVPFYHAIGFTDIGEESVYHGIRYTPMELQI